MGFSDKYIAELSVLYCHQVALDVAE